MNALEIRDLCVDLGKFRLNNINLTVRKGAITGLIGANGAGKSTLIKTIMRTQAAQSGSILYDGIPFAGNERKVLGSVACVFDSVPFNRQAKPKKLVGLYRALYPNFNTELYERLMHKFNLPQDMRVIKYSFGMQKKLNFIFGLCQGAETLILDEPTSGVDPFDRNELTSLIQEYMLDENRAVIFSTHITEDLDKIADYIVMLDNGNVVLDTDKESLTEKYILVRTPVLTPEMAACAKGVTKDMFGYTFITENKQLAEAEGVQVKTPTVEELFVHMVSDGKNASGSLGGSSSDIFGI